MQRIITLINLVLITVIAYLGVDLFYNVVGARIQSQPEKTFYAIQPSPEEDSAAKPLSHYHSIAERDLFDINNTEAPQVAESKLDVDDLEETTLQLKLWGTVSGAPNVAYAVIEDIKKREQNLYRINDVIQEATVKAILREKVILAVNGKDEILTMEEARKSATSAPSARPGSGRPDTINPSPGSSVPSQNRTQRISLNRSMIDNAMNDINQLATQITISPHVSEDGGPDGLALKNIKPNSIFRRMGLRNGDILTGVDGEQIQSVDDALRLYENLKTASGVQVQILRRGQERTIDYNIR